MSPQSIHPDFKLNGQCLTNHDTLLKFVKDCCPLHYDFLKHWFDISPTIIAHTSGSTGMPKPIELSKKAMIYSAHNTIDFFKLSPGTSALLNLSSSFIAGKMMWVRALTGGLHLDVIPPENESIKQVLIKKRYDFGAMVPLQVYKNLEYIEHIAKLIIGGGVVSDTLKNALWPLKNQIFATYGMTETITHIAVKALNKQAVTVSNLSDKYFTILNNIQIQTDDRGCLVIKATQLNPYPIITNDLVEIIDEKHFYWLGRYDNIINSGGVKLIPEQIENKIKPFLNQSFFVASLPDEELGQKVVLIIEGTVNKTMLNTQLKNVLDRFECPKEIFLLQHFITTESGKVHRLKTLQLIHNQN
jgi:O-succinylbenzoic acid--CoA ligase